MTRSQPKVVLWTGPKGSDKTTGAMALAEKARAAGFSVAGVAAPGLDEGGRRMGFDVVDLHTSARAALARRGRSSPVRTGRYGFLAEGLAMGREALSCPAAMSADLVIVDEFGPLELRGEGWRPAVDALVSEARGLILLVVRESLAASIMGLYRKFGCVKFQAHRPWADAILELLGKRSHGCGAPTPQAGGAGAP